MHESELIVSLTGSLGAALLLGFLTQKIGLSPVVGYLLAGLVVGPYTPGFVANRTFTGAFAELGIILLMFGVGLALSAASTAVLTQILVSNNDLHTATGRIAMGWLVVSPPSRSTTRTK